ncbi:MAG TPA: SAF domain-containing protein, partial [Mycobacterium sp.]|nr:SAF domain-containing protein [Mycobacterium sp.]
MREPSLNPTLLRRISTLLRPDWTRTVLARRVAAGGLVVLAGIATLRSNPDGDSAEVVVAVRDLQPGTALTPDDVRLEKRSTTTLPDGAQAHPGAVVGSTLASPMRRGEVLTDVRLLGSRLAESTAGPGARLVPLHLADS